MTTPEARRARKLARFAAIYGTPLSYGKSSQAPEKVLEGPQLPAHYRPAAEDKPK